MRVAPAEILALDKFDGSLCMVYYKGISAQKGVSLDQPDNSELVAPTPVTTEDARRDDVVEVDNVTLARLIAEVRNGDTFEPGAYNRQHNRHNR
jgi:hypothetical protein